MNPYSALGNAVFIEHRENEISVLAHFKQGSIRVNVGDRAQLILQRLLTFSAPQQRAPELSRRPPGVCG